MTISNRRYGTSLEEKLDVKRTPSAFRDEAKRGRCALSEERDRHQVFRLTLAQDREQHRGIRVDQSAVSLPARLVNFRVQLRVDLVLQALATAGEKRHHSGGTGQTATLRGDGPEKHAGDRESESGVFTAGQAPVTKMAREDRKQQPVKRKAEVALEKDDRCRSPVSSCRAIFSSRIRFRSVVPRTTLRTQLLTVVS